MALKIMHQTVARHQVDEGSPEIDALVPSRPGESHPEPLTDPDLNLSIHPARAIR
jgi:hypothetical protein